MYSLAVQCMAHRLYCYKGCMNSNYDVTIYFSVLKEHNLRVLLPRVSEIKAARIVPIKTARTVNLGVFNEAFINYFENEFQPTNGDKLPEFGELMSLPAAIEKCRDCDIKIFLSRIGEPFESLVPKSNGNPSVCIFIEPEAGWTETELAMAKKNKLTIVDFGKLEYTSELVDRLNHQIDSLYEMSSM